MSALSTLDVAGLVVGALLVGLAKTALGGVALISVALFAAVLPARESTAVLLLLLMVGDIVAVTVYRRNADWPALLRLVPSVLPGVLLGVAFLALASGAAVRRTIGVVLLVLVVVHVVQHRRLAAHGTPPRPRAVVAAAFGGLAGFTTMVANAGGPVMALYLLAARLDKLSYVGTSAWFFLVVNAVKVPFSVALGLLDRQALVIAVMLAPAVLVGAALGLVVLLRIPQARFEQAMLALVVLAAASLLW